MRNLAAVIAEQNRRLAERAARCRAAWDALPDGPEKAALQAAMIERAVEWLTEGLGEAFDALVEFLPDEPVKEAADKWLDDQCAK